jgi:isoquinoline 1-oxidoreductase beta subunit
MTTNPAVTRRQFLQVSVTAGGALLIATVLEACASPQPTATATPSVSTAATPAGTPSASPSSTVAPSASPTAGGAFEPNLFIRIDPDGRTTLTVYRSEMGQGVRTALAMVLAEELDVDWSSVHVEQLDADDRVNQVTSGSGSVALAYEPLQDAGAQARQLLLAAAAKMWGVPVEELATDRGEVSHAATSRRAGYGDLVGIAAGLPFTGSAPRKDPATYRLVGTSVPRVDDPAIVTGRAVYGLDVRVPAMRFATVARCPFPGGRLAKQNASAAMAVPGVRSVVTVSSGVAVVGDTTWAAIRGREALQITWDRGPDDGFSTDSLRTLLAGALSGPQQAPSDRALTIFEAEYETPFLAHAPIEPPNCVADVRADGCEVWAPTQNPLNVQKYVEDAVGVPTVVHVTLMGGAFGRKLEVDYPVEAAEISKAVGGPVQVVWTREDDLQHDFYRQITRHRLRAGWTKGGVLRHWRHDVAAPGLNGIVYRAGIEVLTEGLDVPYEIADMLSTPHLVDMPVPTGPWRAVMGGPNAFANEGFIDEVAIRLRKDPYRFRLSLLPVDSPLRTVLTLAATKAGWTTPLPRGTGRGIAAHMYHDTATAMVAEASVAGGQIRVHRVVCAIGLGRAIHPDMVAQQIEGAVAYGLSTLDGEVTHSQGQILQHDFRDYPILQLDEMPGVEVHIVPSSDAPTGAGEMGVPPILPAVANAVANATGIRLRRTPVGPQDLRPG